MLIIETDDRGILDALKQTQQRIGDLKPFLSAIGEEMVESTKRRFAAGAGPDGERWQPNTEVTILEYLGEFRTSFSGKTGKITSQGVGRAINKRPLFGKTETLWSNINYQIGGDDTILIGSPTEYAGVQQFGAKQGAFGRDKRNHPIPWGDIPARPFLGVSTEDRETILDILSRHILS